MNRWYNRLGFRFVGYGERCPLWAGFCWDDFARRGTWVAPIGINLVLSIMYLVWLRVLIGFRSSLVFWQKQERLYK